MSTADVVSIITALALLVTAVSSVVAAFYGRQNHNQIGNVHTLVNGQTEQLLNLTTTAAHAEGFIQGSGLTPPPPPQLVPPAVPPAAPPTP